MYTFRITSAINQKGLRIDFGYSVFKDGLQIGSEVLPIYAQEFNGVASDKRKEFVNAKITEECKKFMVAKDVLTAETDFTSLLGAEVQLTDIVYKTQAEIDNPPA